MTTIKDLLGIAAVNPYKNNRAAPLYTSSPSRIYGLELEIENVRNWEDLVIFGMSSVEDGSLRNNGREFITKPTTYSVLAYILETFFRRAKLTEDNYSERTSVHVHVNCQDLKVEQLATVCLLYQVFEKLLFRFAGADRDKNIFCVPWSETNLNYQRLLDVSEKGDINQFKSWQKYTALNLLPLFSIGTVEFRHLPGTHDQEKILNWVNLIGCLFEYATSHTLKETQDTFKSLNSNSLYEFTLDNVFKEWAPLLKTPTFIIDLEEGVMNFKFAFVKVPKKNTIYDDILMEFNENRARVDVPNNPAAQHTFQQVNQILNRRAFQWEQMPVAFNPEPNLPPTPWWMTITDRVRNGEVEAVAVRDEGLTEPDFN